MGMIDLKNKKILMVDDDEQYIKANKFMFLEEGLELLNFSNPIEALEYLKSNQVDVILLDYYMPQLTGEKFVEELRNRGNETVVILQTGYAGEKPPMDMMNNLNIQGYFDKTKDVEDLILMTISAIKITELTKTIKQKDKEIDTLNYKNEFMGGLIVGITDSLKNQTTVIEATIGIIKNVFKKKNIKDCDETLNIAQNCVAKESNILRALDFHTNPKYELKEVFEIVSTLSKVKLLMENTNLKVDMKKNGLIKCNSNILIMVLLEIIIYLSDKKAELIQVEVIQIDKNIIEVLNKFEYETSFINKIKAISNEDDNIEIDYSSENKILKIYVAKI